MIQRLSARLMKWWLFTFRNKTIKRVEVGGFVFRFRKYWLDIHTISNNWRMRIRVDMHPYGYLYASAIQENTKQLHGYAVSLYMTSSIITQDQGFVDGLCKELNKYHRRQEKHSASEAVKVSDIQESSDENLMREAISRAGMTNKERRRESKRFREEIRNILKEDDFKL